MSATVDDASSPTLLRALGLKSAILIVVGSVIGSGIFLKPGNNAARVGDFPLIIAAWLFGGVLCLLGALCFAELAAAYTEAGGLYVYLREAYGRPTAFCFGWSDFLFVRPASTGALAVAFIERIASAAGQTWHPFVVSGACALLLASIATVNIRGVVWGAWLQNVTTFAKAGGVLFLAVLPFVLLALGNRAFDAGNYSTSVNPGDGQSNVVHFAIALLAVMWAYDGWHQVAPISEEIVDPQRNVPRALLGGVLILMALYVGANLAYHGVLSMSELAAAGDNGAKAMATKALGAAGGSLVTAIIVCSTFGTMCNNLLTTPRIPFAMARDGLALKSIGSVHPRFRTPAMAIGVQASMAAVMVLGSALWVLATTDPNSPTAAAQGSMFGKLTDFAVFTGSIFYGLGVLAVIVLRRTRPNLQRPYRTWGYPLVPILFLAAYAWFLYEVYRGQPFEANVGLGIVAGLFVAYFFVPRPKRMLAAA